MALWRCDALVNAKSRLQDNRHSPSNGIKMTKSDFNCLNQKDILINLNDRLAAYLERVRTLEESNHLLEEKIKEASKKRTVRLDYSHCQKTIDGLQGQIRNGKQANSELWLSIENTKRAADAFKQKYESELAFKKGIADDVKKLKATSSGLEIEKRCLEAEVQILTEELENLKEDHKEEKERLLQEKSKLRINVAVDSRSTEDLNKLLEKMRQQYEAIANSHRRHCEALLEKKFKETTQQKTKDTELLDSQRRHFSMLRKMVQDLEIEREVHRSLKSAEEEALHDIEVGYAYHLENIQGIVFRLENELARVRSEADKLTSDSRLLYYLKDLLEMEIRTYGHLMDEEENRLEDVISESSRKTPPNHRQMFLFLISESKFSITKDLLLEELATRRSKQFK